MMELAQSRRPTSAGRAGTTQPGLRARLAAQSLTDLDESEAAAAESSWTVGYLDVLLLLLTLFAILLGVGFMDRGDSPPAKKNPLASGPGLTIQAPPAEPAPASFSLDPRVLLAALQSRSSPPPPAPAPAEPVVAEAPKPAPPAPLPMEPLLPVRMAVSPALERLAALLAAQGGDQLELHLSDKELRVELRDEILFPLGSAELGSEGRVLMQRMVDLLRHQEARISVEGHTDDLPIATKRFPSNWELSLYRATSVARLLIELGIPSDRIQASGFADTQPRVTNDSPEHRARNRRVSLVLHLVGEGPPAPAATLPTNAFDARGGWTRL